MASQGKYAQLPNCTDLEDGTPIEKSLWEDDIAKRPRRRWFRFKYLPIFFSGILIGVLLSTIAIPVGNMVSRAIERAREKALYKEAKDINEYYGIVKRPAASDPICGSNRHEAKANGCRYDLMASRWYPNECFHEDVLERFLKEVDFNWYRDPEHTELVPVETALSGDYDKLYPLHDFHIIHCLYQFRRLHMAIIEHRQIDDDVFSYGHTVHCTKLIMQWPTEIRYGKNTTTQSPSDVSYCIKPFL